uniref:glutamine--fructose-6-phosphate transaminase (isomerizing) n=1 Tax=viral metagenome TaxID=1070528 RepID=A0A6C0D4I6_9ZZZZ
MCGITFIYSKTNSNVLEHIFNSLELIQNRGYDSMGICYYNENTSNYDIIKKASTPKDDCLTLLKNKFNINKNDLKTSIYSKFAVGHTRWATHGGKTDANAHPHISNNGEIILVHNGIINNFLSIKEFLISKNYTFYSETDSEVIANLLEYYINNNASFEEGLSQTLSMLEGTWGLVIIYTKISDTFYVSRRGSPLLLASNTNYILCSSEINGFNGLAQDYIALNDNSVVKISNNNYTFLELETSKSQSQSNNCYISYSIENSDYKDIWNAKNQYAHWMLKEINEQPETIQKAYNYGGRINGNTIKLGGLDQILNITSYIEYIYLIGCGTSYNAALTGEIYLNELNKFVTVKCINACEFTENCLPNIKNYSTLMCVFLSQSGETLDVFNCLKICKNKRCLTMGIINKVDSLLAREVECGVYLNAGLEISVASTKSFTSMLVVLSLVSMWFVNNHHNNNMKINSLRFLSHSLKQMLFSNSINSKLMGLRDNIILKNYSSIFILGKHKLYPVACESSLKIKEVCYIHCEGFSAGSLKHGPFALLDNTNLTLLLIDSNDITNYNNLKSTYYEIIGRETNLFVITNSQNVINELQIAEQNCMLINKLDYYNEILFTVLLQKLAYMISIAKGINPDKPKNLAKVVTVE